MKILGLLRHAKSEESEPRGVDFTRELNAKGRRAAEAMGRHIGCHAPQFDMVVASPAARVQETLRIAVAAMDAKAPPRQAEDQRLYLATSETIAEVASERGDGFDALLIASHNPGLEDFVLDHVPDHPDDELRRIVEQKYPTGAFALIEFEIDDWTGIVDATGRLVMLTCPRDLDPSLGPEKVD